MPPQARETAMGLDYFIAENAKSARAELKRLGHKTPLRQIEICAIPANPRTGDLDAMLQPLVQGRSAAVLSDAGCPGVADPGAALVRRAHEKGVPVVPLVGPSSVLLALMASGLNGQHFSFHGYLPIREPARSTTIGALERDSQLEARTQIFIEAPYRNEALVDAILATCRAPTLLCLATNLTLPGQQVATKTVAVWRSLSRPEIARQPTVFLLSAESP